MKHIKKFSPESYQALNTQNKGKKRIFDFLSLKAFVLYCTCHKLNNSNLIY